MTELARVEQHPGLLNPATGELMPATVENAGAVLQAARGLEENLRDLKAEVTAFLVATAEERGTKTLHADDFTVKLTGGDTDEYDAQDLMEALRLADCPEDRIEAAVTPIITYKVNRSVLKQLAVNPNYKAAIELARRTVFKPYRAAVETRRSNG